MKESPHPDLWAIIAPVCAAASVGTLAGILVAVRQINPVLRLEFDLLSWSAGLATGFAGWWLGRGLWRLGRSAEGGEEARRVLRGRVVWGLGFLGFLIVLGFVVATVGIPDSRRRDMVAGGLLALVVLGCVGWIISRLARLFGQPDEPEEGGG